MTTCPEDCEDATICPACYEIVCPTHEADPDDTATFCARDGGLVHGECHQASACHCPAEAA